MTNMTKPWALVGLVVAALVFLATVLGPPDPLSEWPTLVQAADAAASVFFGIWFIAPWLARLTRRARRTIANARSQSD
jgi:cbb3-type cytochrome oxidase subunit 3